MVRKGRVKDNVAGERYDSNAISLNQPTTTSRSSPAPNTGNMKDLMGMFGGPGGGGMPDMSQMMAMMQGMPGGMPGMGAMVPPMEMMRSKVIYVYGLAEGSPTSTFYTFYPHYLDRKRTVQQGRRIPKSQACEDFIVDEMSEVCTFLRLPHVLEPMKKYPRDWLVAGRVRVRLVRDDGSLENPEIRSRKALMLKMAELIPKLQSRKVRLAKEAEEATSRAAATAVGAGAPSGSGKKKGKKKGKR